MDEKEIQRPAPFSNASAGPGTRRLRGAMLVLCVMLIAGHPIRLALATAVAISALPVRGAPLLLVLLARLVVTGFGVAAGRALASSRPAAVGMAQTALALSALMDAFVYTTSFFPNNRMPGDTPFYLAASLGYHLAWMLYLYRWRRVNAI
jgi:hypothetical protein